MEARNIKGERFGRLTAIEFVETDGTNCYWKFRCDCGTEFVTAKQNVLRGQTKSCGCLRRERCSKFMKEYHKKKRECVQKSSE